MTACRCASTRRRQKAPRRRRKGRAAKGAAPAASSSSDTPPPDNEQPAAPAASAAETPHKAGAAGQNEIFEFHTDKWAELYSKRIDDMIAALKSKGVPVLWVGMPAIRGTKSTSDMSYLDELYRARADKAGITYVDIWDGFVDDQGRYAVQGPDFEGQIRRLRTYDGVNFTKAGAEKLAHYVEHELRRVLSEPCRCRWRCPGPRSNRRPREMRGRPSARSFRSMPPPAARAASLSGTASHPAQHETDPLATRVLSRGDAIPAPAGRADDFSWPRADANAGAAANAAPEPMTPAPAASPAPKGPAGKNETNKTDTSGTNKSSAAKTPAVAKGGPAKPRSSPTLDGASPRPAVPAGPAVENTR